MLGNERTQVNDTIMYRDWFVSMFNDNQKLLIIFVNDIGDTKVISYDSNFYCIEDNIIAYREVLFKSIEDNEERNEFLKAFIDFVKQEIKDSDDELNIEYLEYNGFDRGLFE